MRRRTLIGAAAAVVLAGAFWIGQSQVSAQGWGMMGGYGPGYHMGWGGGPGEGGGGPGWNCPAFAQGSGPGYAQGNLNLTTDDVKDRMGRWLAWRGNPRLKLGDVKEKDADSITADVITKENSLVERFIVDRHTGFTRRDNS